MLQKYCRSGIRPQRQDRSGRALSDPHWPRNACQVRAGNFPPAQHERRVAETGAGKSRPAEFRCIRSDSGRTHASWR